MEDDLDEDTESTPDMASASPITAQTSAEGSDPEPGPSSGTSLPWCKCGICQVMPQEIEKKMSWAKEMCHKSYKISRFQKLCLDRDVLQLAIRNRGDIRNDREDNSTRSFRKTSYR